MAIKRITFRLEDTQEYQDLLRQQEVEQSRTPASAIAQALRTKNVGPVAVDPAAKAQREYDYATQPPEVIQQGIAMLPEAVQPVAELLAPSRADLLTMGATKLGSLAAKATGLAKPVQGMVRELITYHGTPHTFPAVPDNPLGAFDASKIGTGEGAQAYGHGIYVTENPEIGKYYKEYLSGQRGYKLVDEKGKDVTFNDLSSESLAEIYLNGAGGNYDKAKKELMSLAESSEEYAPTYIKAVNAIDAFKQQGIKAVPKGDGSLYTADLPDAMIDRMLDWDKPFVDQSQEIKDLARNLLLPVVYEQLLMQRSGDFVEALAKYKGGKTKASELLRQSGIPGIKYLDAGSRGTGNGTRNFVVFPGEESNVKILKRE